MEDLKGQLEPIFDRVGYENIFRPIYDKENRLISRGSGKSCDIIPETLGSVNFKGKTVVDLGCNFGYFAFLAARLGASRVVGIDIDEEIVRGCRLLGTHYGLSKVEFHVADFTKDSLGETFDVGLMIDFIGRRTVRKGKVLGCIKGLERLSNSEMLIILRSQYDITDDLDMNLEDFASLYPAEFVQGKQFHLLDFVCASLGAEWDAQIEVHERCRKHNIRIRAHFIRK